MRTESNFRILLCRKDSAERPFSFDNLTPFRRFRLIRKSNFFSRHNSFGQPAEVCRRADTVIYYFNCLFKDWFHCAVVWSDSQTKKVVSAFLHAEWFGSSQFVRDFTHKFPFADCNLGILRRRRVCQGNQVTNLIGFFICSESRLYPRLFIRCTPNQQTDSSYQ